MSSCFKSQVCRGSVKVSWLMWCGPRPAVRGHLTRSGGGASRFAHRWRYSCIGPSPMGNRVGGDVGSCPNQNCLSVCLGPARREPVTRPRDESGAGRANTRPRESAARRGSAKAGTKAPRGAVQKNIWRLHVENPAAVLHRGCTRHTYFSLRAQCRRRRRGLGLPPARSRWAAQAHRPGRS